MGMVVKRKIPVTEILGLKHVPCSPQPIILITVMSQLHMQHNDLLHIFAPTVLFYTGRI
jgi:hypothetical protein